MKFPKFLTTVISLSFILASCSKSGSGTGDTSSSMQFQLGIVNPLVTVNLVASPGTILWNSGSAYATQVKLEAKQNGTEVEFKTTTPRLIDPFAPVAGTMGNVTLPAGTYTELEFKISLDQNGSTPALVLNGQYTNASNTVIPVQFVLNSAFILKSEQNNITVTANGSITALTTLDMSLISNGITQAMLNSATVSGGKIIISALSNINLYNIIINNLQQFHHVEVNHH